MVLHRPGRGDLVPSRYLRPGALFFGLGLFLFGALVGGATLTTPRPPRVYVYAGPLALALGVALVGGALVMMPSDHWLDPDVEFEGWQRGVVVAASAVAVVFAGAVALCG
jgi:heme A synthase